MAELPDSLYVLSRWYRVAGETQDLLHQHEELMDQRAELCRRRAALFRELLATAKDFVNVASTDERQLASATSGTVESSSRSR